MPADTPEPFRPDRGTSDHLPGRTPCTPNLPCLDHLPAPELVEAILAHLRDCWRQGERVPAAVYLEGYATLRADPEAAAAVVYQEYVLRAQPDDPTLFADYVRRYPQYAAPLRRLHEADQIVQHVFRLGPAAPVGKPPRRFGDYELLEEIGRGGMGVVWKARQVSLRRVVALKMILAGELASADAVERFLNEARAAARLQHPNIVAIHEVGSEAGLHFFSMELVEGQTLAQLTRDNPLPPSQAARHVEAVARAIHHAHRQGVLHRDLKPSNVIIDGDGQPHVTDFGLARQVEGDQKLTGTGQVLGTPSYMPPEQAGGGRGQVGPAGDVYSLGAVLYELLTGRPPFQAASPVDTLMLVIGTEPVPPRALNPSIPRDLETICLKCLQKDVPQRYPSAEELADDLARFQEGKPVRARPVGPLARAWRWCRRRPVVAGLTAALLASVLGGFAAVLWQLHRVEQHRVAAEGARDRAREEGERAQANLEKAQDAVDFIGRRIGEIGLANVPQVQEVQREVLEYALRFHEGFLEERGDEPAVRWEAVKASLRVGEIRRMLGRNAQAEAAYRRAIRLVEELPQDFPTPVERHRMLIGCYGGLSLLFLQSGRGPDAEQVEKTLEGLFAGSPGEYRHEQTYRRDLAAFLRNKSIRLRYAARPREAEDAARRALALLRPLVKEVPGNRRYKQDLANVCNSLAIYLKGSGRLPEARQAYQEALEAQQQLAERFPGDAKLQDHLATTYRNLGVLLRGLKEHVGAQQMFLRAEAVYGKLSRDYPAVPHYHYQLGEAYHSWALLRAEVGRPDEALALLEKAVACQRQALQPDPTYPSYRHALCKHCYQIADINLNSGDHERAARAAADMAAASRRQMDFVAAAGLFARCARLAEQDACLSSARREELAREDAAQAVRMMRRLLASTPRDRPIAWDPVFAPFLGQEDFKKLLREAATKPPGK
jgi:tetratricopeptide (TPR) repeat protein